jgi:hypothetical protein
MVRSLSLYLCALSASLLVAYLACINSASGSSRPLFCAGVYGKQRSKEGQLL